MAKSIKNDASKRTPFNWAKLKKLWDEGKSYVEMAKALDTHYNPGGDDPTKSTRAKCSVAMTKGIKVDGKLVRFKRRSKLPVEKGLKPKPTVKKQAKKTTATNKSQKPKDTVKKTAKVTVLTPTSDKPTQPIEA